MGRPGQRRKPFASKRRRFDFDPLEGRSLLATLSPRLSDGVSEVFDIRAGRAATPPGRSFRVDRDIPYRDEDGDREGLDVYRPSGPAPIGGRPVVLAIHGGGWTRFRKEDYRPVASEFARRGFVVVAPDYRLSAPGRPSWPTNFEGLRDAVLWVRAHAREIGADPDRIAAMGESAGGHLAELLGTYPDGPVNPGGPPTGTSGAADAPSARVQAVVSFYGPSDLARLDAGSPEASSRVRRFLGASPKEAPGRYSAASPVANVSADDPPMMLVHGSADTLVRPSQSIAMARRLRAVGVRSELVIVPGAPHGFGLRAGGLDLAGKVARFLAETMR